MLLSFVIVICPFELRPESCALRDACKHVLLPLLQIVSWLHLSVNESISQEQFFVNMHLNHMTFVGHSFLIIIGFLCKYLIPSISPIRK